MDFLYYTLLTLFITLSLFMILLVLIQKGRGGGLSAAFGGAGGNTAFGAKTGDVLTWATAIVFGVFVGLAIGLNLLGNKIDARNRQLIVPTTQSAPVMPADDMAMPTAANGPAATQPTTAPSK